MDSRENFIKHEEMLKKEREETRCECAFCNNKAYSKERLSPTKTIRVCRKHHRMYNLGWSEHEATKGKRNR